MTTRTTLRLSEDLQATIAELAERDRRSLHSQILWLIEKGVQADEEEQARLQTE